MTDPRIRVLFTADEIRALGRCPECGWHEKTQGHHPECADYDPDAAPTSSTVSNPTRTDPKRGA